MAMAKEPLTFAILTMAACWNTALAYIQTRSIAERKELGDALTAGVAGGMAVSKDRNFPAVCRPVPDMIAKGENARAFLQREIGRAGAR